jgi:archaeosine synthase beta-subunit
MPRIQIDDEPDGRGGQVRTAAVFLVGRGCPWDCVMCDLWRHMIDTDTPPGAIAGQVRMAVEALTATTSVPSDIKLYNAGSFLDPHAVPPSDYPAIAAVLTPFSRIVIESHPALVSARVDRWRAVCPAPLEIAIGLETAHPEALRAIGKGMTVDDFRRAATALATRGIALRVFLLVSPPFVPAHQQDDWLRRSIAVAFECGARIVSLIPLRTGNAALTPGVAQGLARRPSIADLERAAEIGMSVGGGCVLVDLWDTEDLSGCDACRDGRLRRLSTINVTQRVPGRITCSVCAGAA